MLNIDLQEEEARDVLQEEFMQLNAEADKKKQAAADQKLILAEKNAQAVSARDIVGFLVLSLIQTVAADSEAFVPFEPRSTHYYSCLI